MPSKVEVGDLANSRRCNTSRLLGRGGRDGSCQMRIQATHVYLLTAAVVPGTGELGPGPDPGGGAGQQAGQREQPPRHPPPQRPPHLRLRLAPRLHRHRRPRYFLGWGGGGPPPDIQYQ
jgi:hypothetical protein